MTNGGTKDVTCVVEGESDIRGDIGGISISHDDTMFNHIADILRGVRNLFCICSCYLDIIHLQQRHQVAGRWSAIDRSFIPILVEDRNKTAVVKMCMGNDHGINFLQG